MSVTLDDIRKAREVVHGTVIRTPILPDNRLSHEIGANAFVKAENLQRSGSFKIRGAYNKISNLTPEEKQRGVVTGSAGNHAQGVAMAARLHGIKSTIVFPEYAPLNKISATKKQGAEVILHGASFDEAVAHSRELAEKNGYTYVHAFDDPLIIAGQGTTGLEIAEDLPDANVIVVPIGGGGIISGIAIAVKELIPGVKIIGVQSENCASIRPSLAAGKPIVADFRTTIADGIAVKRPGDLTLPIVEKLVDEIVEVSDEEIARAIYHGIQNNRLVVEGAGAAGVAALLAGKIKVKSDDKVCAVLCGGNIDANLLNRVIEQALVEEGRYVMFKVLVPDRPGNLATLLKLAADAGANVIEVFHRRAMWLAPLGKVGIEMLLEVRDKDHARSVEASLSAAGYQVDSKTNGEWES
jgi:threonine dehydratase